MTGRPERRRAHNMLATSSSLQQPRTRLHFTSSGSAQSRGQTEKTSLQHPSGRCGLQLHACACSMTWRPKIEALPAMAQQASSKKTSRQSIECEPGACPLDSSLAQYTRIPMPQSAYGPAAITSPGPPPVMECVCAPNRPRLRRRHVPPPRHGHWPRRPPAGPAPPAADRWQAASQS